MTEHRTAKNNGQATVNRAATVSKADCSVDQQPVPTGKISVVFGSLKRPDQRLVTIEAMNETIARAWSGERSG